MKRLKLIAFLIVACLPTLLFAQVDFGGDGDQVYDVNVPFDDGVWVLVAIGIIYGIFKVIAYKKSKKLLQS